MIADSLTPAGQLPSRAWGRAALLRRTNGELQRQVAQQTADLHQAHEALQASEERLRALQQRLMEKERLAAIGMTAAKMVHEIGNPLNGMAVATQLLQRRLDKQRESFDEKVWATVQSLRGEIVRLSHLLQEFRSLSRQQQFALQPTNLSTVVQEVMTTESGYYTERGVSVDHHLPLELPLVMADGDNLKQVVLNLCKNAVEAMSDGGTLSVRLQRSGERLMLEVADTGMGIPVGVDIFEPFVTTKPEGTGLGLAIVRQIIAAHSGSLNYTSVPGKGTTFVVTLPLLPANENGRPSSALGVTA